MMKNIFLSLILFSIIGCELTTDIIPPKQNSQVSNHLVINEVFALSPSHQSTYSWIEVLNPTPTSINTIDEFEIARDTVVAIIGQDTSMFIQDTVLISGYYLQIEAETESGNPFSPIPPISLGKRKMYVPLNPNSMSYLFSPFMREFGGGDSIRKMPLDKDELMLITNDYGRLEDHTDYGEGRILQPQVLFDFDTLVMLGDFFGTISESKIFGVYTSYKLSETSEINLVKIKHKIISHNENLEINGIPFPLEFVVIDSIISYEKNIVDVVRFGNYPTLIGDGNESAGLIPEFNSLARFAGGYHTGNTKNDFYFEPQPLPLYHNGRRK